MHILLTSLKRAFPQLNRKAYTYEDVQQIAKRNHINLTICEYNPDILGYYCTRRTPKRTKKFIVLNSRLDEYDRTFTGLHELAHFFLHVPASPNQWFYCRRNALRTQSKHDCEADAAALIAMIPIWMMIDIEASNDQDIHPSFAALLIKRRKIWDEHGI